MKKINHYFLFYKTKFLPPLSLALFTLLKFRIMLLAVITLLATTILIWFYQRYINDKKKQALYFYYNLGLTELKLFTFLFFINLILLIGINIYIQ
jgi:hypothetical protein